MLKTVRKAVALALTLALQGAALASPLVHAHPDDHATDHHAAAAIHAHIGGHVHSAHRTDAAEVDAEDHDRAVFLNAFVAVTVTVFSALGVSVPAYALPVPAEHPAHRVIYAVHSHDPPLVRLLPSRAPPAFLS